MAGYRLHSFDLNARDGYGRPLRPFNAWQWLGVGFIVAGLLVFLAVAADKLGWIDAGMKDSFPASTSLLVVGMLFVSSRREPLSPEQTAKRRRQALVGAGIGLTICLAGLALILHFKGA